MKKVNPFKFTGPLDPEEDYLVNIIREGELKETIKGLSNQTYYALVGPRQTGKTTFLFQLMKEITDGLPGFQGIYLTLEDLVQVTHQEFYKNLARKILTSLNSHYKFPDTLKERYKTVHTNLDLKDFLIDLARARLSPADSEEAGIEFEIKEHKGLKFILLIDEIDAIPQEIMIEFVKTVRSIFIERLSVSAFKTFTMVLCGASDLASLTYGKTSPFNISKVIYLRDFSFEEINSRLIRIFDYLEVNPDNSFIHQLFEQTNGHPYLTQLLCSKIVRRLLLEGRQEVRQGIFGLIDEILTDGDINLLTTLEKVKGDELLQEMMIKILKGDSVRYTRTHDLIYNLELAGAIRRNGEYCQMRNPIYERFFKNHFALS